MRLSRHTTTALQNLITGGGILMRLSVLSAAICLSLVGLSVGEESRASIKKTTEILPQPLGVALRALARDRGFQLVYESAEVNPIRTRGARGALTSEEALTQLLSGTGFTYEFLDDNAVSIRPMDVKLALEARDSFRLAQAPGAAAEPAPSSQPGGNEPAELQEVIVTAQKREERLQDVPISIAVLDGKALDKQATGGTLEALLEVPGISQSTSDAGGMTQVSIRGVSPAVPFGGGSSTIGYYIDSIPFALVRSAAVPNTSDYDMSRIEVLRGPQGTLYGASALNGVVRVLTNDADPTRFDVKARVGGADTRGGAGSYRADAAVNIPLIENELAVRVVGGFEREGGWIDQPVRGVKNANSSLSENLRIKVAATPMDNLRIDLAAWLSHERYDAASYADDAGNQSTPLAQPGRTNYGAYNARIVYDLPFMSISSATSYLDFRQKLFTDFSYNAPALDPHLLQLYSDLPAQVTTEELLLNSRLNGPWRWSAGFFYRDAQDDRYQTLPAVLAGHSISWSDRSKSYAGFGQITRSFADGHFELSGGLRYFHDRSDTITLVPPDSLLPAASAEANSNAVTPRVAATWLPSPNLTAYISYSQGFRSGLNQTPLTLLSAPLPPARPDKLNNYEVGAKGSLFGGFATYDTAVYYIKWNDIQQAGSLTYGDPPAYISATINGVSASGFGTDLSLTLHPARGLQVGGSLSYNGLKEDEDVTQTGIVLYPKGSRLAFSPQYSASAFSSYAFPLSANLDGQLRISADYRSKEILRALAGGGQTTYCTVTGVNLNAYCESGTPVFVNADFALTLDSNKTVSLYVRNLTNWSGLTDPSYSATTPFRPRPRTVGIQLEAKY
jgi:iron complex outermembrane recepter protein